jgi:GNAT superfamily N-acetyltransferase
MKVSTAPLTVERWPDLARLFEADPVCRRCWCMWFLVTASEFSAGYRRGARPDNRTRFEQFTRDADPPAGLLAYSADTPAGWCATGPRSRYGRLLRSPLLRGHPPGPDDWFLACLFVDRRHRGQGVAQSLVESVVRHASGHGARKLEALPLAGTGPHDTDAAFVGTEPLLGRCGFTVVARPSPGRALMRHSLSAPA